MDSLFSRGNSYAFKEAGKQKMLSEIDRLTEAQVMKTKLEELTNSGSAPARMVIYSSTSYGFSLL